MNNKNNWLKNIKKILTGLVLVLFLVIGLLVVLMWQASFVSGVAKKYLNKKIHPSAQVQYQSLKGSLFNHLQIKNLTVKTNQGIELNCNYLEVHYRLWPLLKNKIEISSLVLDRLNISIPESEPSQTANPFNIDTLLASWQKYVDIEALIGNLPDLKLRNFEIVSGEINLVNTPVHLKQIKINIPSFRLQKNRISIKLEQVSALWPEYDLKLNSMALQLEGDPTGIILNQGEIKTNASNIYFNALLSPEDGLNFNITSFHLELPEFRQLMGFAPGHPAFVEGSFSFSGMPVHFGAQGNLKGQWQRRRLQKLAFNVEYNRGEVLLKKLAFQSNLAQITAAAYWNQQKQISGRLSFDKVDLNLIDEQLPQTILNGRFFINAENLNFKKLTGQANLEFYHCLLDTIEIDSIRLKAIATRGFYSFQKPSFIRLADSSTFFLEGALDRRLNINLDIFTFNNALNQTFRDLGLADLKGQMDGRIHLQGPISNPDFSANLIVPELKYDMLQLDSLKFNAFIQGIGKQRIGSGSFKIAQGKIDRFPIDQASFDLKTVKNHVEIKNLNFLSRQNYFSTSIFIDWQETLDSASVKLFPFKVQYENYWLHANDTLNITLNQDEIILESFTLNGPQNSEITLNGFFDFNLADFQGALSFNQFEIAPFKQFFKSNVSFSGKINGFVELLTPLTDLSVEAELQADSLRLQNVLLGRITSDLYFAKDLLTINDFTLSNDTTFLGLQGEFATRLKEKKFNLLEDTEVDLVLDWERLQLSHYAPLFKGIRRLKGVSSGQVAISGTADQPQLKLQLNLNKFNFETFPGDSLQLKAHNEPGKIVLDELTAVIDGSSVKASGWQDYNLSLVDFDSDILNKPFWLHVTSKDDQIVFLRNLIEEVESIQGPYQAEFNIQGTPLAPKIESGHLSLENGQLLLSIIRDPIRNVNFKGTIKDHVLHIEKMTAVSMEEKDFLEKLWRFLNSLLPWTKRSLKEGHLFGRGKIDLSDLNRPGLDLALKLDEFYVDYFIQNVKAVISSENLTIKGRDTIYVSGDLYIPKGVVEIDLDQIARSVYLSQEVIKPEPPFLALNLDVEIPGNFTVTSSPLNLANNFRIVFMGDLHISMVPPSDEPSILGHLEAISGKYSSWNQNFIVQNATIDFKNKIPIDPDIDVVAIKQLGNKKFELALNGSVSNLNQQMRVFENGRELALSAFDKISLLTLGADVSTVRSSPDSALRDIGEKIATTSILTAMERGAERFTGLDRVEINASGSLVNLSRFRLNNGLSDASIAFGKYLTSDLYVEYRTRFGENIPAPRLSWGAGNRIGLQYRINRYWTLDSYYEKTERGNTRIRFGLNWEYSF